jgi:hypothetical protein
MTLSINLTEIRDKLRQTNRINLPPTSPSIYLVVIVTVLCGFLSRRCVTLENAGRLRFYPFAGLLGQIERPAALHYSREDTFLPQPDASLSSEMTPYEEHRLSEGEAAQRFMFAEFPAY